jgi:hypothetical protein
LIGANGRAVLMRHRATNKSFCRICMTSYHSIVCG